MGEVRPPDQGERLVRLLGRGLARGVLLVQRAGTITGGLGHRDAEIYTSLPGLGVILAVRVLGEFGDAPDQYADAKARKNYAGTSPVTRASGTKKVVLARDARNRRLGDALQQWAFCSLRGSPGARATTSSSATERSDTRPRSDNSRTASSASSTAA
jgi:transposase